MKHYNSEVDGNYKYSTGEDIDSFKASDNVEIGLLDPVKFNWWYKKQYPEERRTFIDLELYERVLKEKRL